MRGVFRWLWVSVFLVPVSVFLASDRAAPTEIEPVVLFEWQRDALQDAHRRGERLRVPAFPLRPDLTVELSLEPFRVTSDASRFVIGNRDGAHAELDFDPAEIVLFRGEAVGRAGSSVYLAVGERLTTGWVDLGPGSPRFGISSRGAEGEELPAHTVSVFEAAGPGELPPDAPLCGTISVHADPPKPGAPLGLPGSMGLPGVKHLELAVETDHELFQLFGNAEDTAAYLVALYGAVSDIYLRDVGTRVELVFARIWDDPDDLFNDVDPSPLPEFRSYWNTNMTAVSRDVAQLLSGRRDYPFGGQAYLSSLCEDTGYSVVGYAAGFFPDPSTPSPYHYDISVTAHELGHSSGTGHTHDPANGIDTCQVTTGNPQRGTIMSYCGQTWSGGNANRDQYFHTIIQGNMWSHISSAACVVDDCNGNSIDDATDVTGTSADANANGVPDECEDCNGNGILDDADIAATTSRDRNRSNIPDECEADCNGNQIPDDFDIAMGPSEDLYGNGIPDECEADCDNDGTSDYTEIQSDMGLDLDRNAVLDACQDCDVDGTSDLDELGNAHGLWVASGLSSTPLRAFHAATGVLLGTSGGGHGSLVGEGQDVLALDDGRVLVSSGNDDRVLEYDAEGSYQRSLVAAGAGGLMSPAGLVVTPDGRLLVASRGTDSIESYDVGDGTPLGTLVTSGAGGLTSPFGVTLGPDGHLYVTSATNEVLEFDVANGTFLGKLVSATANGGLDQPRGLTFKPDGNLLVASFGTNEVLEYERTTGTPLGKWAQVGTATRLTQISPWGVRVGPNGNVFVVRTGADYGSGTPPEENDHEHNPHLGETDILDEHDDGHGELHLTNAQIYEFDGRTGNFLRTHIGGNDHGMLFPSGFAFVPGWDRDCNLNLLPDECDVASGTSLDENVNSVPDECEIDCNGNGRQDRLDIVPYGSSFDCNANLVPDSCDVAAGRITDTCAACATSGDCDDGLVCTLESCGSPGGTCAFDVAASTCLINETCRAVNELNPLDDCEICDPATPTDWSPSIPVEVAAVELDRSGTSRLSWNAQGPGFAYDIAGGTLANLTGDMGTSEAACLADDLAVAEWEDARPDPTAGDGYYYLVRSQKSCGAGTYGQSSDDVERDAGGACP